MNNFQKSVEYLLKNLFETASDTPIIVGVAYKAHKLPNVCLGVYWYKPTTGVLLFSNNPTSHHLDRDLFKQDKELLRLMKTPEFDKNPKEVAYKNGWISGRVGKYENKTFAYVYRNKVYGSTITKNVGKTLLQKLAKRVPFEITYLLDDEGYNLL